MTLGEDNGVGLDGYYDLPNLAYCFPSKEIDDYVTNPPLGYDPTDKEGHHYQMYFMRLRYNILLRVRPYQKN